MLDDTIVVVLMNGEESISMIFEFETAGAKD